MTDFSLYKSKLEEQLTSLNSELGEIGIYDHITDTWTAVPEEDNGADDADENENADYTEAWDERRSTFSALEHEYRDIKRALTKIQAGAYGRCEIGGETIEEKRLQAKPAARTCITHMNDEGQLPL